MRPAIHEFYCRLYDYLRDIHIDNTYYGQERFHAALMPFQTLCLLPTGLMNTHLAKDAHRALGYTL